MGEGGTILIVDHDEPARSEAVWVALRLGYEVCSADSGELVLERLDGKTPLLAIIEVELPGAISGLELLRELHERFGAGLPVILVSAERTSSLDRTAGLMLNADDYVVKPFDRGELLARTRRSLRRAYGQNGNGRLALDGRTRPTLSPREREVLTLLAEGKTQKQMAEALFISPKTVATHIHHLLAKLDVNSRAQAVAAAYQRGLVDSDFVAHAASVPARRTRRGSAVTGRRR